MRLSIIIVSWNVRLDVEQCLKSIERYRPTVEYEVILVDNGSSDGTVGSVKDGFAWVNIVANRENRGFAAANNQAMAIAKGQYLFLLNPDTIVHPGLFDTLTAFMDKNDDVGACGPRTLNSDGTVQSSVRHFPSFRAALYRYTFLRSLGVFRAKYSQSHMHDFGYDRLTDVDQLMGAALLVRGAAIEQVGTMDERFFMYYEEVDLCYRLKSSGWRIVFVPEATVTHLGGRSSDQVGVDRRKMALQSLLKFFRKHRGRPATIAFKCILVPGIILQTAVRMVWRLIRCAVCSVKGDVEGRSKSWQTVCECSSILFRHIWTIAFRS